MRSKTLKLCFRDRDWEWLQQQQLFRAAAQSIKTFEDVERVSRFGARLIQVARNGLPGTLGATSPPRSPENAARNAALQHFT